MVRRPWKLSVLLAGVLGGLVLTGPSAEAGLLPVQVSIQPDGENFRFTYNVVLTSDSKLEPGDFFTIYDFAGLIDGSNVQPDGFTFSSSPAGQTPIGTVPTDDPGIPNLTWTYSGTTVLDGQIGLGNFSVISSLGLSQQGQFTARTHRQVDGQVDSNITEAAVPLGQSNEPPDDGGEDPPPVVPEPATLALVGLGLPLVGAARYLRRKM